MILLLLLGGLMVLAVQAQMDGVDMTPDMTFGASDFLFLDVSGLSFFFFFCLLPRLIPTLPALFLFIRGL